MESVGIDDFHILPRLERAAAVRALRVGGARAEAEGRRLAAAAHARRRVAHKRHIEPDGGCNDAHFAETDRAGKSQAGVAERFAWALLQQFPDGNREFRRGDSSAARRGGQYVDIRRAREACTIGAMAGVVIGIANTSDDIIELLRLAFERAGWTTAAIHLPDVKAGRASFEDFLRAHEPAGLVIDIAPPYDDNWRLVKQLRSLPAMRGRAVVITTTNVRHLARLADEETGAIEIVGKPNDIQQIVDAMQRALAK